jgi:hypothetical protein
MSTSEQQNPARLSGLSEDWQAVIIGMGLALLVWLGVIKSIPWPLFGIWK